MHASIVSISKFATVGVLACLTLSACGGGTTPKAAGLSPVTSGAATSVAATSGAASPATAAVASSSAASPASPAAATSDAGGSVSLGDGSFCSQAKAAAADAASSASALGTGTPAGLRKLEDSVLAELKAVASSAPGEIKGAVLTIVNAEQTLDDTLKKANYDVSKVDPSAVSAFSSPALTVASKSVTNYLASKCGITTPTGAPSP